MSRANSHGAAQPAASPQALFANLHPDKSKGQFLALDSAGKLLAQGDDPQAVVQEARAKGCPCPVFLDIEIFEDKALIV